MGIKRIVDTSFWTDNKVDEEFSPEDKYFMLYIMTNPFTTQLGIYEISIRQAAFQLGYSKEAVEVLIDRFENKYNVVIYSPETKEIAIKNYLRHSIMKGGAPVRDCLIKEMKQVKNKDLIVRVFSHIKGSEDLNETVKNIIAEYEEKNGALDYYNKKEIDNDKENENDNDNDVSYHDSSNVSYHDSSEQKKNSKPVKHKHGEYKHVLLTEKEFEKLTKDFGEELRDKAIKFLDEYIEEKGYKSKSHNLAIRRWVIDAVKDQQKKKGNARKEIVPKWAVKDQQQYDFDDLEAQLLANGTRTAANDPDIKARADALKQQFGG